MTRPLVDVTQLLGAVGRGPWIAEGTVPNVVVALFAVLTQLGDVWFVVLLVTAVYLLGDHDWLGADLRRTGALLVALVLGAFALTVALKLLFALPRPPEATTAPLPTWLPEGLGPVYRGVATGDGFGFPSGHAIAATVTYGGLAILTSVGTRLERAVAASTIVGLVVTARIVLGVHYLGDVIVGILVGLAYLAVVLRVAGDRPSRAFAAATVVGAVALLAPLAPGPPEPTLRGAYEAAATFGAALGGLLTWRIVDPGGERIDPLAGVAGFLAAGGLWVGAYTLEPPLPAAVAVNALAVAIVIGLPHALRKRDRGRPDRR